MNKTMHSDELLADIQNLSNTANTIKEETEGFENDIKSLEQCLTELSLYWKGNAANEFQNNIFIDFYELKTACGVFKKLSDDYAFAVNEYRKNEQKSVSIIKAIKDV